MIKPITIDGLKNLKASYFATWTASLFHNRAEANGYFEGYALNLNASATAGVVRIDGGLLMVQGRLAAIEGSENVVITNLPTGGYGYIVARLSPYAPNKSNTFTLTFRDSLTSFEDIALIQQDTLNETGAETVYELPLYSYRSIGGRVAALTRLVKPINELSMIDRVKPVPAIRLSIESVRNEPGRALYATIEGEFNPATDRIYLLRRQRISRVLVVEGEAIRRSITKYTHTRDLTLPAHFDNPGWYTHRGTSWESIADVISTEWVADKHKIKLYDLNDGRDTSLPLVRYLDAVFGGESSSGTEIGAHSRRKLQWAFCLARKVEDKRGRLSPVAFGPYAHARAIYFKGDVPGQPIYSFLLGGVQNIKGFNLREPGT